MANEENTEKTANPLIDFMAEIERNTHDVYTFMLRPKLDGSWQIVSAATDVQYMKDAGSEFVQITSLRDGKLWKGTATGKTLSAAAARMEEYLARTDGPQVEEAAKAFARYNDQAGGLTWDKRPIPPWSDVGPAIRNCWRASVGASPATYEREPQPVDPPSTP